MINTKVCLKCKRELPVEKYYKDTGKPDGLCAYCKECMREYRRRYDHKQAEIKKGIVPKKTPTMSDLFRAWLEKHTLEELLDIKGLNRKELLKRLVDEDEVNLALSMAISHDVKTLITMSLEDAIKRATPQPIAPEVKVIETKASGVNKYISVEEQLTDLRNDVKIITQILSETHALFKSLSEKGKGMGQ